jgi:hypothetical protein
MIVNKMESPESIRTDYRYDSEKFTEIVALLKTKYSKLQATNWHSVSDPVYNNILEDDVITAIVKTHNPYLDHLDPILVSRKYLINKLHIYEKVYTLLTNRTCDFDLPAGSNALAKAYLLNIYGQPGDEDYSNYIDIYFSCKDHDKVEAIAGRSLTVGAYSNYYCMTFNGTTKELLKVKNYWYDEQGDLSDWDELWVVQCKKRDIDPLTELS